MNALKGKSFRVTFCMLSWYADIYYIWIDRNARLHAGNIKIEEVLI